ncbi:hypothetical protein VTJ04DRAFT_5192 [Mycothermus thermophilus]|uniref:uncharacterized protein n=1 Tax=Humicola insolens TaxID=85995 RepID=UPI0037447DC2
MAGTEIPGLGHARAGEKLPEANFAPASLEAAAKQQQQQQQQARPIAEAELSDTSTLAGDMHDEQTRAMVAALSIATPAAPQQPADENGVAGAQDQPDNADAGGEAQRSDPGDGAGDDEGREWATDSSPYSSSSESDDDDDDDDDEAGGDYPLLSVEETARLLMAGDADDDDGVKDPGAPPRTKNELPEEILPKPDVTITPDMHIERLGEVLSIVENTVLIKSATSGEQTVFDIGTVLCKEDRTVIGQLADIIGQVTSPMYLVRYNDKKEALDLGLAVGVPIFYSTDHAKTVFVQPLRQAKYTDASGWYDEEPPIEEQEFSDDEQEAEARRQRRNRRRGNPRPQNRNTGPAPDVLNYDEGEIPPSPPHPQSSGRGGPANNRNAGFDRRNDRRDHQRDNHHSQRGAPRSGRGGRGGFGSRDRYDDRHPSSSHQPVEHQAVYPANPLVYGPPLPPNFGGYQFGYQQAPQSQAAQSQAPTMPNPVARGTINVPNYPGFPVQQPQYQQQGQAAPALPQLYGLPPPPQWPIQQPTQGSTNAYGGYNQQPGSTSQQGNQQYWPYNQGGFGYGQPPSQ